MNTLNMDDLKWMFISGANNLSNNYKEVDALNVFPIPDGDTGTNMMMTIQSGINEIQSVEEDSVGVLATTFSKGLLLGARGNSGVILSQIFKGFGDAIKEKQKLYREGRYSTFVDHELFARDTVYQDYELKLKNCSRITIESNGVAFITLTSDDIRITNTRDINYMRYYFKKINDDENMYSLLTYDEFHKIYYYLQNLVKETHEESKKKVLDKK